ncbi:hypothetical protein TR13x_00230 [Caloranaerobacter sp. TR13]|uniref:hypothetical protein n=1 Tax=Caloranaerobacter sp. TR13 TaxID=1302151 RepID=UPI0006D44631|nr:hypothetical protein [Caloranaerobacter sp. TR13]KPU27829.1 hypothetical protein TR13x_00230 [Caloranaerobacter sp. TR13]
MAKKYTVIIIIILFISSIVLMGRNNKDKYYPEMSYEILSCEKVPEFIKDRIDENIEPNSSRFILGDGESYIVLIPPENKSVEVLTVEKNENVVNGIVYRYRYVDKVSDNILDNIKIIKVSNFNGSFTGKRVDN